MKKITIIVVLVAIAAIASLLLKSQKEQPKTIAIVTTLSHPALDTARLGFIKAIKTQNPKLAIVDYNAEGNMQQADLIAEKVANDKAVVEMLAIGTLNIAFMQRVNHHQKPHRNGLL